LVCMDALARGGDINSDAGSTRDNPWPPVKAIPIAAVADRFYTI